MLKGEQTVQMRRATPRKGKAPRQRTAASAAELQNVDADLLSRLKAWRSAQARAQSVPPYVVFHDSTLAAIASLQPRDMDALSTITGIGAKKLERYGPAVLDLLRG